MRPARVLLTIAACALAPAAIGAAGLLVARDWLTARAEQTHPALTAAIAADHASWIDAATAPRSIP